MGLGFVDDLLDGPRSMVRGLIQHNTVCHIVSPFLYPALQRDFSEHVRDGFLSQNTLCKMCSKHQSLLKACLLYTSDAADEL